MLLTDHSTLFKHSFLKLPKVAKIQRLQAFQNPEFVSKIKNAKNMPKTSLETGQSCSVLIKAPKKRNIRKVKVFKNGQNWPKCKGYRPCKMVSLAQKLKLPKTGEKHP